MIFWYKLDNIKRSVPKEYILTRSVWTKIWTCKNKNKLRGKTTHNQSQKVING